MINTATMEEGELVQRFAPISKSEYYQRTAFILEPLYAAAEAAGAILLDPTSTMCHGDRCPTIDASGFPTFTDNQHLYPGYVERFASFLDVTAGMEPQEPPSADEYCV